MAKSIFLKLAKNNLLRNKRMYLPYYIASSVMVAIYFMVMMILHSTSIGNLEYGATLLSTFDFCSKIITLMVVIFMLYINSFIIKQRKKEFGLYGILGLEKRHVARVILWENFFLSSVSLLSGIALGCVFGKLVFMMLIKVFGDVARGTVFVLPPQAFTITFIVFLGVFFLSTLYNLFNVSLASPTDLLKGQRKGEKKLHFVLPLTIIGLALLGYAYYLSFSSTASAAVIMDFFTAAIIVVLATYLLFIAGSVFLLKALKKRQKVYYKAENFITIGSMHHRMRQNAAGLATISILSTMVICTVAITTSIYLGQDDMVKKRCSNDVDIVQSTALSNTEESKLDALITSTAQKNNVEVENIFSYSFLETSQAWQGDKLEPFSPEGAVDYDSMVEVGIITADQYNKAMNENIKVNNGEVVALSNEKLTSFRKVETAAQTFEVQSIIADTPFTKGKNSAYKQRMFLVAANKEEGAVLYRGLEPKAAVDLPSLSMTSANFKGEEDDCLVFSAQLFAEIKDLGLATEFSDIYHIKIEGYQIFGGILFIGVFFSLIFLTAAVLIMYFKQVSEGLEDKERFDILQKIGMSQAAVKRTINKQIVFVFFLPLAAALIHISVAAKIINNMLVSIYLTNIMLTMACIGATSLIFALAYVVVYRLTSKTYYKIVRRI